MRGAEARGTVVVFVASLVAVTVSVLASCRSGEMGAHVRDLLHHDGIVREGDVVDARPRHACDNAHGSAVEEDVHARADPAHLLDEEGDLAWCDADLREGEIAPGWLARRPLPVSGKMDEARGGRHRPVLLTRDPEPTGAQACDVP
jgi:hypothetical protein